MAALIDGDAGIRSADVRTHLEEVLASESFRSAARSAAFLRFVVEAKLDGRVEGIQEYGIGLEVFGRGESFDPRIDSIVRVEARRLRKRLESYYEKDGAEGRLRIELPNTGYVPEFVQPSESKPARRRAAWRIAQAAAGIALLALAATAVFEPDGRVGISSEATTFQEHPPPGVRWVSVYRGGGARIAPDGRKMVLLGEDSEGETQLYLRRLDTAGVTAIDGSRGAREAFWSPDSGELGFCQDDRIRVLDLDRGLARTVVEVELCGTGFGATWSSADGGTILYTTRYREPIVAVSVLGGEPRKVSRIGPSEATHEAPRALSDGRHFVFAAGEGTFGRQARLYLGDLSGDDVKLLTKAESHGEPARSASGQEYLLYVQDDVLLADRLDVEAGTIAGAAAGLAAGIGAARDRMTLAGFSVGGDALAYVERSSYFGLQQLVWVDRTGKTLESVGQPDNYFYLSLSGDERLAAATKIDMETRNVDIFTIDVRTGVATRRTRNSQLDRTPVFSPDGSMIAESSNRDDRGRVYLLRTGGDRVENELLRYDAEQNYSDWPSDWTREGLLFSRNGGIYLQRLAGAALRGEPRKLFEGAGQSTNAKLAPDGRWIAYQRTDQGRAEIFVASYPDLERTVRVSANGGSRPLWRGDGRELFFVAPDQAVMSVELDGAGAVTFSEPRKLFDWDFAGVPTTAVYQYAVSADGGRFLCLEELEPAVTVVVKGWESLLGGRREAKD